MFRKCVSIASALLILGSAALTASAKEVVYDKPDDAQLFCDFNTAFPGAGSDAALNIPTGNGNNQIRIIAAENATFATEAEAEGSDNQVLKVTLKGDGYIRFWSNLNPAVASGNVISARYQYMVMRVKGTSAAGVPVNGGFTDEAAGTTSHSLAIGFGNFSNSQDKGIAFRAGGYGTNTEAKNPDGQPIAQVTDEYQTLIIQLPDDRFSALSDVGFAENMLIRNIGAYEKTLYIDEIYFTNTVPTEHVEVTWNDNNTIPEDAIYIEDGRRDTFALPFGDVKLNYVNGSKASFVNEVTTIPDDSAFSMADGVVTYHAALDNGLSMSLGENYYENYKYIVFRAKAAAGAGDKFAVKLGSNAAQEILFKDLKFSADNYAKELSGEWQDIYVSTDAALNGLNNMPYLKFLGKGEADIQIDCIYMTNTVPEGYEAGRAVEQQGGNDGDKDDGKDDGKDPADKPITETGVALPIGVAVLAAGAAGALVITRRRKNAK